jgi:hypothetical protein
MDALLPPIPAIAQRPEVSAIASASLLSGPVAAGSARTAKTSATRAAASTTTKTTAASTEAATTAWAATTRTAPTSETWSAGLSAARTAWTIAILPTRIVAKAARTTSKSWTEVAARISADLLQPSTQCSVQ